jgi:hypothetical protein
VDNGFCAVRISDLILFLPRFIQERKMKKALAVLIASVFVAGSALAQTPAPAEQTSGTAGAGPATGAATGGITAGMVAAAVAVVAVAAAISSSNSTNNAVTSAPPVTTH